MDINELIAIVKKKLTNDIKIEDIKIEDKSFLHKNHSGNQEGKFHIKITLNSIELMNMTRLESNKKIYKILDKDKINGDYDHMRQFKFNHNDIKAFGILGVSVGLKWKKVQDKFKLLVKKYHPDINAGNKKFEEKLKLITLAYTQLKNTYKEKIDSKS